MLVIGENGGFGEHDIHRRQVCTAKDTHVIFSPALGFVGLLQQTLAAQCLGIPRLMFNPHS